MPHYDYKCDVCENVQEESHSIKLDPIITCNECGGKTTRQLSAEHGLSFKGSGFYATDYKHREQSAGYVNKTRKAIANGDQKVIADICGTGEKPTTGGLVQKTTKDTKVKKVKRVDL